MLSTCHYGEFGVLFALHVAQLPEYDVIVIESAALFKTPNVPFFISTTVTLLYVAKQRHDHMFSP